jgi:hypothetical protein
MPLPVHELSNAKYYITDGEGKGKGVVESSNMGSQSLDVLGTSKTSLNQVSAEEVKSDEEESANLETKIGDTLDSQSENKSRIEDEDEAIGGIDFERLDGKDEDSDSIDDSGVSSLHDYTSSPSLESGMYTLVYGIQEVY